MPLPPLTAGPHKQSKTKWILVISAGAFLVCVLAGLIVFTEDEPPPDTSDFIVRTLTLPDEENAYVVLANAAKRIPIKRFDSDPIWNDMLEFKTWDQKVADSALNELSDAWPLIQEATALTQSDAPKPRSFDDSYPDIGPLNNLGGFIQIKALNEARNGEVDESLKIACLNLKAAYQVENGHGSLIHYIVGSGSKALALQTIHHLLSHYQPSADALKSTLAAVSACRTDSDAVRSAFYSELKPVEQLIQKVRVNGLSSVGNLSTNVILDSKIAARLLLKPNTTLRIYTGYMRQSAKLVDRPLSELKTNNPYDNAEINQRWVHHPTNILGRGFLGIVLPTTTGILKSRLRLQSSISATEAFLALHLYKREHGEFPVTLDALIPAYLPAVPKDYIDGAPIRYSKEFEAVWSIGENNLSVTTTNQIFEKRDVAYYLMTRPNPVFSKESAASPTEPAPAETSL